MEVLKEQEGGDVKEAIAFKVPDPKFTLDRLGAKKETITLSGQSRSGIAGKPMFLINERLKKMEGIFVWAVVTFDQEPDTVRNVQDLGKRIEGLDELTRREFAVRTPGKEGGFHILRIRLIRKFANPIEIKAPPPGRGFGGLINLSKDRLRENTPVDGLALRADQAAKILENSQKAIVLGSGLEIDGRPLFLISENKICGVIEFDKPRKISVKEFKRLAPVHGFSDERRLELWPEADELLYYSVKTVEAVDGQEVLSDFGFETPVLIEDVDLLLGEAFHIEGTHWIPVPESGTCPANFPKKARFPGKDKVVCFTSSAAPAAAQARMNEAEDLPKNELGFTVGETLTKVQEQDEKFSKENSGFVEQAASFDKACGTCRFYLRDPNGSATGQCQVVDGPINWFASSNLYISSDAESRAVFEKTAQK